MMVARDGSLHASGYDVQESEIRTRTSALTFAKSSRLLQIPRVAALFDSPETRFEFPPSARIPSSIVDTAAIGSSRIVAGARCRSGVRNSEIVPCPGWLCDERSRRRRAT